ncbi:hypothetical protein CR513_22056, partial [Mucuna pruriens]
MAIMAIQGSTLRPRDPVICFTDEDYKGTLPHQNDPMVISLIVANYKIERILIEQGSSVTSQCSKKWNSPPLVEIRGTMEIETIFGVGANA